MAIGGLFIRIIGFILDNIGYLYTLVDTHGLVTRNSCIRLRILDEDP